MTYDEYIKKAKQDQGYDPVNDAVPPSEAVKTQTPAEQTTDIAKRYELGKGHVGSLTSGLPRPAITTPTIDQRNTANTQPYAVGSKQTGALTYSMPQNQAVNTPADVPYKPKFTDENLTGQGPVDMSKYPKPNTTDTTLMGKGPYTDENGKSFSYPPTWTEEQIKEDQMLKNPFDVELDWSNYLPSLQRVNDYMNQTQATTGMKITDSAKGSMYEGAIKAGTEAAISDVQAKKAENLAKVQLKNTEKELALAEKNYELGQENLELAKGSLALQERAVLAAEKSANADSGTIICGELQRQGYLSQKIVDLDHIHRRLHIDDDAYYGYIELALPIVKLMKKSKVVTRIVRPLGIAWAFEMASRVDSNIQGHWIGKVLLAIGTPVCRHYWRMQRRFKIWAA